MKTWINKWKFFLPIIFLVASCTPEVDDPQMMEDRVKTALFRSMQEWYFWNDKLPQGTNPTQFSSNEDLLSSIIHAPLDRWSYLTTPDAFTRAFTGQNAGHGFGWGFDENEHLYLLFVYKEAPAGKDNWQRGWRVLEVNGKPISSYKQSNGSYNFQLGPNETGITNTFKFLLPDGTEVVKTLGKAEYQSNSVLHRSVVSLDGKNIGYWVYNSFRATAGTTPASSVEVDQTLNYFISQNVDELVLDLRYNGGGSVGVTEQILNYLVPSHANGQTMYTNTLNNSKSSQNSSKKFEKKGNLNLNRLIVLTSRSSASASELLINCLTPYMEVVLIGANTYGKPVGSFPLSSYNKTLKDNNVELVPITFASANANGRAEYFDGFPVDFQVADDPSRDWGNPQERRYKAAIDYIRTGSVHSPGARIITYQPTWEMIDSFTGLQKEFPAY
ncbi:carboxyl-terminal protease [Litoribacter alkaliphilus]|uniref:Carboxyl-terminal protease n=1 Tax=Litoribacter ruber TaxID=702568 RepID=A0AAP2CI26_9BACT|nr:S41 family peptidase [Litoribacter alkaliphilus]MBS9525121.1 carboxyl-terminal protease [Litoribacter alkaliphilus]